MYPTRCGYLLFVVVVQWNASGLIRYVFWERRGCEIHVLSLGIERIYSTAQRCFLLVQYYVRTLDELRYDVRLRSGMKRFVVSETYEASLQSVVPMQNLATTSIR